MINIEKKIEKIIWIIENSQNYRGWKREAITLLKEIIAEREFKEFKLEGKE